MRIVSERTLAEFWQSHAEARGALEAWRDFVQGASWNTPADVQRDFGVDAVLPDNRACFNIKGNKYRVIVHIHYKSQIVFIRFVGTHDEYNRIDALKV